MDLFQETPPFTYSSPAPSGSNRKKLNRKVEGLAAAPASADRDRLRVVREIGREARQRLAVRNVLTGWARR